MTIHLQRLAVGTRDVEELKSFQLGRPFLKLPDGTEAIYTFTRNTPKRVEELLDGGSLYWIIKGVMRVRQSILAIDTIEREGSGAREEGPGGMAETVTRIALVPEWVATMPTSKRPFQGWRYLEPAAAPIDLAGAGEGAEQMPPEMLAELRDLGLL